MVHIHFWQVVLGWAAFEAWGFVVGWWFGYDCGKRRR